MRGLRESDYRILLAINDYPEGAQQSQIAKDLVISRQNIHRYVVRLTIRKYIRKDILSFLHLTALGKEVCKLFLAGGTTTTKKAFTKAQERMRGEEPRFKDQKHTTRQAYEVQYNMFPTYYVQVEAILSNMNISYKKSGNRKTPMYDFKWRGLSLRITTKKIIAWNPEEELKDVPLAMQGDILLDLAYRANIRAVSDFLAESHIRCQESLEHHLLARVRYYELATVNDEIAKRARAEGGYIIFAYDRETGSPAIWADGTPAPNSLETSKRKNNKMWSTYLQAMQDDVVNPYEDEIRTRRDIEGMKDILFEQNKFFVKHNAMIEEMTDLIKEMRALMRDKREGQQRLWE